MDSEMMQHIIENAVSFPDLRPPVGSKELFRKSSPHRTYIFYGDDQGNYYYDSVEGLAYKQHMAEVEKKQRIRSWNERLGKNEKIAPVQQKGGRDEASEQVESDGRQRGQAG